MIDTIRKTRTVEDRERKTIDSRFKINRNDKLRLGLKLDFARKIKEIKYKKMPKKVGSGVRLVTPLPDSPMPLTWTKPEVISGKNI
tara:strand:- start:1603 stop:1860 length:258 start_codon:yes stop_codon:yes gene_type:complete